MKHLRAMIIPASKDNFLFHFVLKYRKRSGRTAPFFFYRKALPIYFLLI